MATEITDKQPEDVFWGRCSLMTPKQLAASPFKHGNPEWRDDNTCSHCGGLRPSILLKALRENRVSLEPTDKNYKVYFKGERLSSGCPANKCYFNHFSESQAIELVLMWRQGKIRFEQPGTFYSGLCFADYKDAIDKALLSVTPAPKTE